LRRQASEQYLTSAQFFAQRRRQLIASPQTAHGLLGNVDLLPRKPALQKVKNTRYSDHKGQPLRIRSKLLHLREAI